MRVNLNIVAEQIVPEYGYKQFVDNTVDLCIPPLYRGVLQTFYPTTIREVKSGRKLRRYIFKYNSNGTFDFITTRQGQRNGGNNVTAQDSQINVTITDPSNNFSVLTNRNFNPSEANLFTSGSRFRVIRVNGRYLWQERDFNGYVFNTIYQSDPTSNELEDADKEGDVNWFEYGSGKYVVANNLKVEYYNNNTLAGLNSWPIQNQTIQAKQYTIQDRENVGAFSNTLVTETRPLMLDDAYLWRCFSHTVLEAYDIVFVEVYWKEYTNKNTMPANDPIWLGESFVVPVLKGRVYRIGKLAKSNGNGDYDLVTFAQRTRIKTTKNKRGGKTVYL